MRGKKAKALRKAAGVTPKMERHYEQGAAGVRFLTKPGLNGESKPEAFAITGTITLRADSLRSVYQAMKREARA